MKGYFISFLVKKFLTKGKNESMESNDGTLILKFSTLYGILGYTSAILSIIVLLVYFFSSEEKSFLFFFILLFMFVMALILVIMCRNKKVIVDDFSLKEYDFFKKESCVFWDDITKVSFNNVSLDLILTSSNNTKIKVNYYFTNFSQFMEMLKFKVSPAMYEDAFEKISQRNF